MSNGNRIVVGLTGPFGAGCSTRADDLYKRCSFRKYSLSEVMREIAPSYVKDVDKDKLYAPEYRSYQQYIGNEIRYKKIDAISEGVLKRIEKDERGDKSLKSKDIVIDGIRNPSEITFFQDIYPHFFVIAVFAQYLVRWERKRTIYSGVQDDFDRDDIQDSGEFEPAWGQKVQLCVDRSDVLISNNEPFEQPRIREELQNKIKGYIDLMKSPGKTRPQPWELNMSQAYQASLMSTCCKRKVGAVIVKEQAIGAKPSSYVIASGFNDAPLTVMTCIQRGGTTKPDYCYKDEKIKEKLRKEYKHCPKCGAELPQFDEEFSLPFICPNSECGAKIGKDFIPGRVLDLCIAVHAEQAALLQTSRFAGTQVEGSILYTTTFPCPLCAKEIVNAGISKVVFAEPYPADDAISVLDEAKVEVELFQGVKGRAYSRLFEPPPYKRKNN